MQPQTPPEPHPLARGLAIAGCGCAVVGLLLFRVPFLALMLTMVGLLFSGRSMFLYRDAPEGTGETGWTLAIAGLILGIIALVPGVFITYSAAFRG